MSYLSIVAYARPTVLYRHISWDIDEYARLGRIQVRPVLVKRNPRATACSITLRSMGSHLVRCLERLLHLNLAMSLCCF